jgi:hypothetical protein
MRTRIQIVAGVTLLLCALGVVLWIDDEPAPPVYAAAAASAYVERSARNRDVPALFAVKGRDAGLSKLAPVFRAASATAYLNRYQDPAPEVVVHASDLTESALSEFDFWDDPASPGGKLVGTPNYGGNLDPPPENDPHVTFLVRVRGAVPYRCWVHMKVGAPKGVAQANKVFVQLTGAVDKANNEILRPRSASYLTAQGPTRVGWTWVPCDPADPNASDRLIRFRTSGEVTVRVQGGAEGVGFDQFLLSPARFLEKPPAEAVVPK